MLDCSRPHAVLERAKSLAPPYAPWIQGVGRSYQLTADNVRRNPRRPCSKGFQEAFGGRNSAMESGILQMWPARSTDTARADHLTAMNQVSQRRMFLTSEFRWRWSSCPSLCLCDGLHERAAWIGAGTDRATASGRSPK